MEKIFCFHINDCPIIVRVSVEKKYHFSFECLYPFLCINSSYFNENYDFFKDFNVIRTCLYHIFKTLINLQRLESENVGQKDKIGYLRNLDLETSKIISYDLCKSLCRTILSSNQLFYIRKTDKTKELISLFSILHNSGLRDMIFFIDSDKCYLDYDVDSLKEENFSEWLRLLLTEFYFSKRDITNIPTYSRIELFNKMSHGNKLKMYKIHRNTKAFMYFDDLLKSWNIKFCRFFFLSIRVK